MTPAQTQLFDAAILRVLDRNRSRFGQSAEAVAFSLVEFVSPPPARELVLDRLDYLAGKQLVEEVPKEIHRANRTWRITETGINHLDK